MKPLQDKTVVLSVAGLDPSGGAGVYSDVKTFSHFELKGLAVPTVFTVQNDENFKKLESVSEELFKETLNYMFDSYKIKGLKIGLITQKHHIDAVVDCIKRSRPSVTVFDPIISSSSGFSFWSKDLLVHAVEKLFPSVDIITPNYIETVAILNAVGENTSNLDKQECAKKLNTIFRTKVAITGGDSAVNDEITDVYYDGINMQTRTAEYFDVPRGVKHGTGCAFSTALTANICKGFDFITACTNAASFVEKRIKENL
jgi:hydroxymethylpyrimidine/phosphomethylpyrimidine kinase